MQSEGSAADGPPGSQRSYLEDVLPGPVHVAFGAEASHDHGVELRKLQRQSFPINAAPLASDRCGAESHLLAGKQHRAGGQAQFEICGRGLPQLIGS